VYPHPAFVIPNHPNGFGDEGWEVPNAWWTGNAGQVGQGPEPLAWAADPRWRAQKPLRSGRPHEYRGLQLRCGLALRSHPCSRSNHTTAPPICENFSSTSRNNSSLQTIERAFAVTPQLLNQLSGGDVSQRLPTESPKALRHRNRADADDPRGEWGRERPWATPRASESKPQNLGGGRPDDGILAIPRHARFSSRTLVSPLHV
jgi:hypothetical protein